MSIEPALIVALGAFIAYANGSNDISKGIATLVGSGVTSYRRAILWGTFWTGMGGLAGWSFAGSMVTTFGNGLLAAHAVPTFEAALAIIFGAAAWVLVATRTGLPVSTTHAIVGSLVGVAVVAYGTGGVNWAALEGKIVLPLLLSPFVSLVGTVSIVRVAQWFLGDFSADGDCVCAEAVAEPMPLVTAPSGLALQAMALPTASLQVTTGTAEECAAERPGALSLRLDHLHWLTSGATSLARGMNDAPKMAALVLSAAALSASGTASGLKVFLLVTFGMIVGSLLAGLRVTKVLAEKVTPLNHREGFLANLVTSALVTAGAVGGLPMSTTHVSTGAIMGVGASRGSESLNLGTVRNLLLAWVVTLPAAAGLGIAAYLILRSMNG